MTPRLGPYRTPQHLRQGGIHYPLPLCPWNDEYGPESGTTSLSGSIWLASRVRTQRPHRQPFQPSTGQTHDDSDEGQASSLNISLAALTKSGCNLPTDSLLSIHDNSHWPGQWIHTQSHSPYRRKRCLHRPQLRRQHISERSGSWRVELVLAIPSVANPLDAQPPLTPSIHNSCYGFLMPFAMLVPPRAHRQMSVRPPTQKGQIDEQLRSH